jgi:hypothetical protein
MMPDMNIVCVEQNFRQLPVLTPAEKLAKSAELNSKFPVSSGMQHHRKEDEWMPVEKAMPASVPSVTPVPPVSTETPVRCAIYWLCSTRLH